MWLVVLAGSTRAVFAWTSQASGIVGQTTTLFTCAWTGFFVGFVVVCTATLQARRKLLVGRLEPTAAEWQRLDRLPARSLAWTMWLPALLAGLVLAGGLAVLQFALGRMGGLPGYPLRQFQFYTALLPATACAPLAARVARRSVERFVGAAERSPPLVVARKHYLVLHNALPYAVFSTAAGTAIAITRFLPFHLEDRLVPVRDVSVHLLLSALVVVVLVVTASVFKTRLDLLSPVVLAGRVPERPPRIGRYRFWYGLVAAVFIWLCCEAGFAATGLMYIDALAVIWIKASLCFLLALVTTVWAVYGTLQRFDREGLAGHPLVQMRRILKDTGFLVPREERDDSRQAGETERT